MKLIKLILFFLSIINSFAQSVVNIDIQELIPSDTVLWSHTLAKYSDQWWPSEGLYDCLDQLGFFNISFQLKTIDGTTIFQLVQYHDSSFNLDEYCREEIETDFMCTGYFLYSNSELIPETTTGPNTPSTEPPQSSWYEFSFHLRDVNNNRPIFGANLYFCSIKAYDPEISFAEFIITDKDYLQSEVILNTSEPNIRFEMLPIRKEDAECALYWEYEFKLFFVNEPQWQYNYDLINLKTFDGVDSDSTLCVMEYFPVLDVVIELPESILKNGTELWAVTTRGGALSSTTELINCINSAFIEPWAYFNSDYDNQKLSLNVAGDHNIVMDGDCINNVRKPVICKSNFLLYLFRDITPEFSGITSLYSFEIKFVDVNSKVPNFNEETVHIAQILSTQKPLISFYKLNYTDEDFNATTMTVSTSKPSLVGAKVTEIIVGGNSCRTFRNYTVDLFLTTNLPIETRDIEVDIYINDGVHNVLRNLLVKVLADPNINTKTYCHAKDKFGVTWTGERGTWVTLPCPRNEAGISSWFCEYDGNFKGTTPDYSKCKTSWLANLVEAINNMTELEPEVFNEYNQEVQLKLERSLQDSSEQEDSVEIYGHEILELTSILRQMVNKSRINMFENIQSLSNSVIKISDLVIQHDRPWQQLSKKNMSNTLTEVLVLVEQTSSKLLDYFAEGNISVLTTKFDTITTSTGKFNSDLEFAFPMDSNKIEGKESFISLPKASVSKDFFVAYSLNKEYVSRLGSSKKVKFGEELNSYTVNSAMLSMSMLNLNYSFRTNDNFNLSEGIEITFLHNKECWGSEPKIIRRNLHQGEIGRCSSGSTICVYWDRERLIWSPDGCSVIKTSQFSTTCTCSHLTEFALLTELHTYAGKKQSTMIITVVGFILMLLFQIVGFFLKKEEERNNHKASTKYLQMLLLMSYAVIFFLVDRHFIGLSESNCQRIGILIHSLLLFVFTLLSLESYTSLLRQVEANLKKHTDSKMSSDKESSSIKQKHAATWMQNFSKLQNRKWASELRAIFCFALTFLIVIITLLTDWLSGPNSRAYGGDFCWLDGQYTWAFFVPMIFLEFVTITILTKTYFEITGESEDDLKIKNSTKQILLMYGLIGLTWITGFYQIGPSYSDSVILSDGFIVLGVGLVYYIKKQSDNSVDKVLQKIKNSFCKTIGKLCKGKNKKSKTLQFVDAETCKTCGTVQAKDSNC